MAEDDPYLLLPSDQPHGHGGLRTRGGLAELERGTSEFEDDDGFDIRSMAATLWARRIWILAATIIGLGLAIAYSLFQTPLYRSTASLELTPPSVPVLGSGAEGADMVVPQSDWQFLATQYGLMRSQDIGRRVVERLNLVDQSETESATGSRDERIRERAAAISSAVTVDPVPDSRLVNLTYTADKPEEAARIVNAYATAYIQSNLDRRYEATEATRQFLQERLEATRAALNEAESKLVAYARQNNLIDVPSAANSDGTSTTASSLSGASLGTLNSALAEAQQRRIAAEQRFRQGSSIAEVNQSTSALRQEKAKLETEYAEKSNYLQDGFPDMVRLRSSIAALDQQIKQESSRAAGSVRAEYQAALAEEKALRKRVQQLSGDVLDTRQRTIQYNMLQRELDTNRALYDALLDRFNKVGVASDMNTPLATIVDEGRVPAAPFTPNIPRNIILGLILGFASGAGLALLFEFVTDTIKTPQDVREKLRVPLVGVIPQRKRGEDLAEQLSEATSPLSEAYSSLLTTLRFSTNIGFPQALLVTSVRASEGKSTTSFVLATELAKLGKRVLLIDADMRKPSFLYENSPSTGLSSLLTTSDWKISEQIVQTRANNLWLMPSGPIPPNPSQLLSSMHFQSILEELKKNFDCIIIDAPPSYGLADASLIGANCSGVLLLVESGKVRRKYALETIDGLSGNGCTLLGVCLSKYAGASSVYGYNYNYYAEQKGEEKIGPHELSPLLVDGKQS